MKKFIAVVICCMFIVVITAACSNKDMGKSEETLTKIDSNMELPEITELDNKYKELTEDLLALAFNGMDSEKYAKLSWWEKIKSQLEELDNQLIYLDDYCIKTDIDIGNESVDPPEEDGHSSVPLDSEKYTNTEEPIISDSDFIQVDSTGRKYININDLVFDTNGYSSFDYDNASWWVDKSEYKTTWREIIEQNNVYKYTTYAENNDSIKVVYTEVSTLNKISVILKLDSNREVIDVNIVKEGA